MPTGSSSCRDRERPLFLLTTEDLRALVSALRKRTKWGRYPLSLCYLQPGTSCSGISDLAETSSACPLATSALVQGYAQRPLFKHAHNKIYYKFLGGAQRYACAIASPLRSLWDVQCTGLLGYSESVGYPWITSRLNGRRDVEIQLL